MSRPQKKFAKSVDKYVPEKHSKTVESLRVCEFVKVCHSVEQLLIIWDIFRPKGMTISDYALVSTPLVVTVSLRCADSYVVMLLALITTNGNCPYRLTMIFLRTRTQPEESDAPAFKSSRPITRSSLHCCVVRDTSLHVSWWCKVT
jgi:hypothetical protein